MGLIKEHTFNIEVATHVGVNAAIMLHYLTYWCEYNRAKRQNYQDGYYWTFNSIRTLSELIPYLSEKQIRSSISILEKNGYIISAIYNKDRYDRTKWYTVLKTEPNEKPISKMEMPLPDDDDNNEPIIEQTDKTVNDFKIESKNDDIDYNQFVHWWNNTTGCLFGKLSTPLGIVRKKMLRARVREHGKESIQMVVAKALQSDFLKGDNSRNWTLTFDWMLKPSNFEKILSGNYDNKGSNGISKESKRIRDTYEYLNSINFTKTSDS